MIISDCNNDNYLNKSQWPIFTENSGIDNQKLMGG